MFIVGSAQTLEEAIVLRDLRSEQEVKYSDVNEISSKFHVFPRSGVEEVLKVFPKKK